MTRTRRIPPTLAAAAALAAGLAGQPLVSPATRAATEGNFDDARPFGFGSTSYRYLQVHSDLRGRPGSIGTISFRRDGLTESNAVYQAKTITASLWFGRGRLTDLSPVFDANFATPATKVATLRTYSMPDWTQQPPTAPAPFDFACPLDAPFVWTGEMDFVWEMRVAGMSSPHSMFADAERADTYTTNRGVPYGTGCIATGQAQPMEAFSTLVTNAFGYHELTWACGQASPSAPIAVFVAVRPAALPIAGLCAPVAVELPGLAIPGVATVSGSFQSRNYGLPYDPHLQGSHVYAQCICVDAARADPIKLALSRGVDGMMPQSPWLQVARVYAAGDADAPRGTIDAAGIAVGLVIRLD
jgi:hypothetical protein